MTVSIEDILSKDSFAVFGSFRSEAKYAFQIVGYLQKKRKIIYPVNPGGGEVLGLKCYRSVEEIGSSFDVASIVTPPSVTEELVVKCAEKGCRYIWMQPGAESEKAIEFCNTKGLLAIYNSCILMS